MKGKVLDKRTLSIKDDERREDAANKHSGKGKRKFRFKGKIANDPNWHGKNSQIVNDLCNYPFNHMQGFPVKLGKQSSWTKNYFASLMVLGFDWFTGISENFKSMLNTAATNIWEFVRSRNAGATNYQAGDIFTNIVIGALDIVSTVQYCVRLFGSVKLFSVYNRLSPRMFIESMGIQYDDFVSNIAVYRGRLNLLIAKATSIVLPKQFPLYDWVASMSSNIYKDRDSDTGREQYYAFGKKVFHIYDSKGSPNGGRVRLLKGTDIGLTYDAIVYLSSSRSKLMKFDVILNILEAQINAIVTDEDCNIIMGDLIKAYGSEAKFWSLHPVTDDEAVTPIYSEEVLNQIHNAILLPSLDGEASMYGNRLTVIGNGTYTNTLEQDENGYLISNFSVTYGLGSYPDSESGFYGSDADDNMYYLIDSNHSQPSPDEILNMSRMQNRYYVTVNETTAKTTIKVVSNSAIILFADHYYIGNDSGMESIKYKQHALNFQASEIARASVFDWHPILYNMMEDPMYGAHPFLPIADLNNCVAIDGITLQRMHDVDFASLLDIPFTGKF